MILWWMINFIKPRSFLIILLQIFRLMRMRQDNLEIGFRIWTTWKIKITHQRSWKSNLNLFWAIRKLIRNWIIYAIQVWKVKIEILSKCKLIYWHIQMMIMPILFILHVGLEIMSFFNFCLTRLIVFIWSKNW